MRVREHRSLPQDIDLDATAEQGYEVDIEDAVTSRRPYHPITFALDTYRYSADGNFSGSIDYEHANSARRFELQISYRLDPILPPRDLVLEPQSYLKHVECGVPVLHGLDPYQMIGEKIMASNRRGIGGSKGRVRPLPLVPAAVRRQARPTAGGAEGVDRPALQAPARPRRPPRGHRAQELPLDGHQHINRLVPGKHGADHAKICSTVRTRLGFIADLEDHEAVLLEDQTAHRERRLFNNLREEALAWAADVSR